MSRILYIASCLPPLRGGTKGGHLGLLVSWLLGFSLLLLSCSSPVPRYDNIFAAIAAGDLSDVKLHLHQGTPLETGIEKGNTPLANAIYYGQPDIVRYLIRRGARLDYSRDPSTEPVVLSVRSGDTLTVLELMRAGLPLADPPGNLSLLEWAVAKNRLTMTRFLVARGWDIHAPVDDDGQSIIHAAAAWGSDSCLAYLIEMGFDPNEVDSATGATPLIGAALSGELSAAQVLIERGADPTFQWLDHYPGYWAEIKGHDLLSRFLYESAKLHALTAELARRDSLDGGHRLDSLASP